MEDYGKEFNRHNFLADLSSWGNSLVDKTNLEDNLVDKLSLSSADQVPDSVDQPPALVGQTPDSVDLPPDSVDLPPALGDLKEASRLSQCLNQSAELLQEHSVGDHPTFIPLRANPRFQSRLHSLTTSTRRLQPPLSTMS